MSEDLPPGSQSADHLPYGADTIVIPLTWSRPPTRRPPWRRFGGNRQAYPPDYVAQSIAVADRSGAERRVDSVGDPTAPVPVVDDQGNPVIVPDGPLKGTQMLRPAGLDPHLFVSQGIADKAYYDALLSMPTASMSGDSGGPAMLSREVLQLSKFQHFGEWDAQRVGGVNHPEYIDYSTVAIGLYAASAGMSRDEILRIQDVFAAWKSIFARGLRRTIPTHICRSVTLPTRIWVSNFTNPAPSALR